MLDFNTLTFAWDHMKKISNRKNLSTHYAANICAAAQKQQKLGRRVRGGDYNLKRITHSNKTICITQYQYTLIIKAINSEHCLN